MRDGARDDVLVGEHVALGVDHHARAEALRRCAAGAARRSPGRSGRRRDRRGSPRKGLCCRTSRLGGDVHDGGADALALPRTVAVRRRNGSAAAAGAARAIKATMAASAAIPSLIAPVADASSGRRWVRIPEAADCTPARGLFEAIEIRHRRAARQSSSVASARCRRRRLSSEAAPPCARSSGASPSPAGACSARPREPDRRAHRLQRRAGAALRDRPRHRRRRGAPRRRALRVHLDGARRDRRDRRGRPSPAAAAGSTTWRGVVAALRSEGLPVPRARPRARERRAARVGALELGRARGRGRDAARRGGPSSASTAPRARALAHRAENEFVGVPCGVMDQFASALGQRWRRRCASTAATSRSSRCRCPAAAARADRRLGRAPAARGGRLRRPPRRVPRRARRARDGGIAPARRARCATSSRRDLAALERALDAAAVPPRAPRDHRERARGRRLRRARARRPRARRRAAARGPGEPARRLRGELARSSTCSASSATRAPGCYGSRLTGAGFGGCTLHLVDPARADAVAAALRRGFAARFGREPAVHRVAAAAGAGPL